MRVKYKPTRGRYVAARTPHHHRHTAACCDAAADWLVAGTGRAPRAPLHPAATNNFKFLFMFLATTVAVAESARFALIFRVILS